MDDRSDDVRYFIEVGELLALWHQLVLPRHVRRAWLEWFDRRGIDLPGE